MSCVCAPSLYEKGIANSNFVRLVGRKSEQLRRRNDALRGSQLEI